MYFSKVAECRFTIGVRGEFGFRVLFLVSLTLTLGWKNEKQPYGPIELDLEAGNLVHFNFIFANPKTFPLVLYNTQKTR